MSDEAIDGCKRPRYRKRIPHLLQVMTAINPLSVGILATFTFTSTISHLVPLLLQAPSHLVPLLLQASSHLVSLLLQESSLQLLLFFIKTFLLYLFIVYFLRLVYLHLSTRSLFIRVFIRVSCIHVRCLLIIVTLVALFLWFPEQSAGFILLYALICRNMFFINPRPEGYGSRLVIHSFCHLELCSLLRHNEGTNKIAT